jgi:HSP20 family protein
MLAFLKKKKKLENTKEIIGTEIEEQWIEKNYEEGQLAIDVYETDNKIIIKSTMAGVKPEDIDISINNDMLTVRGLREETANIKKEDYLYKECYWGSFSRSIILPTEVDNKNIGAELENGVLTIRLKKISRNKKIKVSVKG